MKLLLVCTGVIGALVWAQQAPAPAEWDNSPRAAEMAAQFTRLKPLLDQLVPEDWAAQGADITYVQQWQNAQAELASLNTVAAQLDRQPNKLSLALDTYFRLQSVEWRFESLIEGARRYQNPAIADQMASILRGNSANRDSLRAYITDSAARQEQELMIVTQDAQRCRMELSQIPASARRTSNTKK